MIAIALPFLWLPYCCSILAGLLLYSRREEKLVSVCFVAWWQ